MAMAMTEVLTGYEEVFPGAMEQNFPKLNELRMRICQVCPHARVSRRVISNVKTSCTDIDMAYLRSTIQSC